MADYGAEMMVLRLELMLVKVGTFVALCHGALLNFYQMVLVLATVWLLNRGQVLTLAFAKEQLATTVIFIVSLCHFEVLDHQTFIQLVGIMFGHDGMGERVKSNVECALVMLC